MTLLNHQSSQLIEKRRTGFEGSPPSRRAIRIAVLGCGGIGSKLCSELISRSPRLEATVGQPVQLCAVLVRNTAKDRGLPDHEVVTDDPRRIFECRPDVIIEVLGDLQPAAELIEQALRRGISVVTANKTLIAHHGTRLHKLARLHHAQLKYEAAVCAAIPLLNAIRHLEGDFVRSIQTIASGTCNYILTRMQRTHCPLHEALESARKLGLVEPDPEADLSGRDVAEKLVVLAHAIGLDEVCFQDVELTGITNLTQADFKSARDLGYAVRLIGEIERDQATGGLTLLRVGPTLVPRDHPLAGVDGSNNAVQISCELAGPICLAGAGAGPLPTTSALLGDVVSAIRWRQDQSFVRGNAVVAANDNRASPGTSSSDAPFVAVQSERKARDGSFSVSPIRRRRYFVRASFEDEGVSKRAGHGRCIDPEVVFKALDASRTEADQLEIVGQSMRLVTTAAADWAQVKALSRRLKRSSTGVDQYCAMLMPVLE